MVEHSGWLLDLYEDPLGGLVVWFLDDDGTRRQLRQRFPVTFYAAGRADRLRALEEWLMRQQAAPARAYRTERKDVIARRMLPVLALEMQRPADLPGLFRQACRTFSDLEFADADLPVALRYAAATGVSLLGRCRLAVDSTGFVQSVSALDTPWDLDPPRLPLRVLRLEPDCDPAHAEPRRLQVHYEQHSFDLELGAPRPLLVNLRALLNGYDPDLLLTTWGDTWLLPRLLALSESQRLHLPLNRDRQVQITRRKERWYFSYVLFRYMKIIEQKFITIDPLSKALWQ